MCLCTCVYVSACVVCLCFPLSWHVSSCLASFIIPYITYRLSLIAYRSSQATSPSTHLWWHSSHWLLLASNRCCSRQLQQLTPWQHYRGQALAHHQLRGRQGQAAPSLCVDRECACLCLWQTDKKTDVRVCVCETDRCAYMCYLCGACADARATIPV